MNRSKLLYHLSLHPHFNVIIIGGGATGLGAAIDAASRGLKTLLIEGSDIAKGTSSRSTKLIHGGLRYLQQGNITLVREALKERGRLLKNAPHIVSERAFIVPSYHWWETPFFGAGLKIYDLLAGELGIHSSKHLNQEETLSFASTLNTHHLQSGILFYDGQFDDARLAISLMQTFQDLGGTLINYMKAIHLMKEENILKGLIAEDQETKKTFPLTADCIINATGIFSDAIRQMDDPKAHPIIVPSQGIHLVLPRRFLPGETGIVIPHTDDGRVLFMVPWNERVLVGTTDTLIEAPSFEPIPLKSEIDFLLHHLKTYLSEPVSTNDILSIFAGIRPLVNKHHDKKTSKIARDHVILVAASNLITIAGGKWTTYRKMGQDVIDKAIKHGLIKAKASQTKNLKIHGYLESVNRDDPLSYYGSDLQIIHALLEKDPSLLEPLHPRLPYLKVQVLFGVRYEMARTIEDILARRTRALLLDAKASLEAAPLVTHIMAKELEKDVSWIKNQLSSFEEVAKRYLP